MIVQEFKTYQCVVEWSRHQFGKQGVAGSIPGEDIYFILNFQHFFLTHSSAKPIQIKLRITFIQSNSNIKMDIHYTIKMWRQYTVVDWVWGQQIICWPRRWTLGRGPRPRATVHLRGQQIICCPKTKTTTVLLYPIFLNYVQWWTGRRQTKWSITQHKNVIHFFFSPLMFKPFFKTKYGCNSI